SINMVAANNKGRGAPRANPAPQNFREAILRGCAVGDRQYVNKTARLTLLLELYDAVDLGEQRIVLAAADVLAGLEGGTALANENRTAVDRLAGKALNAKPFGMRVAAVSRSSLSFLMCHGSETS